MPNTRNYLGQDINTVNLVPSATETQKGIIEIANAVEALGLTDDTKALTATKLGDVLDAYVIGINQTWQDVTASRASGVTYTNTTGKPIYLIVNPAQTQSMALTLTIDGVLISYRSYSTEGGPGATQMDINGIVPNGSTYSIFCSGTISRWFELRS